MLMKNFTIEQTAELSGLDIEIIKNLSVREVRGKIQPVSFIPIVTLIIYPPDFNGFSSFLVFQKMKK
jgi:hypothetical protein